MRFCRRYTPRILSTARRVVACFRGSCVVSCLVCTSTCWRRANVISICSDSEWVNRSEVNWCGLERLFYIKSICSMDLLSRRNFNNCCRQALMAQRGGSDSDKLNPTHVTSSRALGHFDQRTRNDLCSGDDDDKLLDVVGPPQSPLLPLGHSLSQFNTSSHAGKHRTHMSFNIYIYSFIPILFVQNSKSFESSVICNFASNRFNQNEKTNQKWFHFIPTAWFNHFAAVGDSQLNSEEMLRKRLQLHNAADDSERDGSDSSCSESVGGSTIGAFRPTGSPKDGNSISYPAPNISVGPPIHPPPHLLPYLYPPGLYPPHHLSLLHNPATAAAMNHPNLNFNLFNAQLALAAQHPAFFGHYSGHSPVSPLHALKGNGSSGAAGSGGGSIPTNNSNNRFTPYNLPSGLGSAFDAVLPSNSKSSSSGAAGPRSLSSSPRPLHRNQIGTNSPPAAIAQQQRPISVSPTVVVTSQESTSVSSPSELKSIEKMVNGLDVQKNNGNSINDGKSPKIELIDQWHQPSSSHIEYTEQLTNEPDTTINANRSFHYATHNQIACSTINRSAFGSGHNGIEDETIYAWRNSWPSPNIQHPQPVV